jgi:hypothetical protein
VKPRTASETVIVSADSEGLVSHAETVLLAEVADRTGLTEGLSEALSATRERRSAHASGRVLTDVAVMLARWRNLTPRSRTLPGDAGPRQCRRVHALVCL